MTTLSDLLNPPSQATNKLNLLTSLAAQGFPALSWETGSVPSALVEIQAAGQTEIQAAEEAIARGGLNSFAEGEALALHSDQVYNNQIQAGLTAIGYITLTDVAGAGPFTFDATSTSYSVGLGGKLYRGLRASVTGLTTVTLPKNGSVDVDIEAESVGAVYNAAPTTINVFARGVLPGVNVSNPSDWQTKYATAQSGVDAETDARLRERNVSKWGTLGTGSPAAAYKNWAFEASQAVTRVAVYSNVNMLDPATVDVILAGPSGPVAAGVVLDVQNYIAPAQIGGERIPETARCKVASAIALNIAITATLYVQASYNTAAFQTSITNNLTTYFASLDIGALVSWERILQVLLYPAGLSPGIITNATLTSPVTDVQLVYVQVATYTPNLTFVSV